MSGVSIHACVPMHVCLCVLHILVCVCVCACVRACMCVCGRGRGRGCEISKLHSIRELLLCAYFRVL